MDEVPTPSRRGRPPVLSDADRLVLGAQTRENPTEGAKRLTVRFNEQTSREVTVDQVRSALKAMGWRRMKRPIAAPEAPVKKDEPRYPKNHRSRLPAGRGYPSDVDDAEWALVAPLLRGKRGPPPEPELQRATFNAILYIARTGCPWRYLPHDFPAWNTVSKTFYRWVERGVWLQIQDTLRRKIRVTAGREEEPSVAIIDSQSVKTTEKGGSGASTPAKRSKDGSGISLSIRSGY